MTLAIDKGAFTKSSIKKIIRRVAVILLLAYFGARVGGGNSFASLCFGVWVLVVAYA